MAERKPSRLDHADCAVLEHDDGLDCVVHLPSRDERPHSSGDRRDLADQEARQVDDVGA
jgi:hypothetical protein